MACNIQDEAPVPVDPNAPSTDSQTAAPTKPPDMQFDVHLEDLSLFLGWQSSPAESVCLADLDFIDVTVNSAPKSGEDAGRTDVSVGGNMLRVRTCPGKIVLLQEVKVFNVIDVQTEK